MSGSNNQEFGIIIKSSGAQTAVADAQAVREGLHGIKSGADQATASADRLGESTKRIGQLAAAYLGVTQITAYGREILNTAVAQDRFNSSISLSVGAGTAAASEYAYITSLAHKLGLEMGSTAEQYASWTAAARGTSLEGERGRLVFDSVSGAVSKMGLNGEQTGGVFMALTQMMSKGVVAAEEFRGQLGERLPIATTAGAKAMGVTTAEFVNLLNSGKLVSEDFLPKFAIALKEMSGGGGPVETLQASLNRLDNDFTQIRQNLGSQVPIKFVVTGIESIVSNTQVVSAAIMGVTVAAASYGSIRMGAVAMEAVSGMRAKSAALAVERAATLEVAQAEMMQAEVALASARANNSLGTAHHQVTAAETAHAAAASRLAAAQAASAASTSMARGALALVGGPVGAITLLLGAGATAWSLWGSSARDAANQAAEAVAKARQRAMELGLAEKDVLEQERQKAIAERDRLKATGASTAQIKAQDDIAWEMRAAMETIAIREKNQADQAKGDNAAWQKMTQTKAQQREADIEALSAEYLKRADVQRLGQAEQLKLAEQYHDGLAKINEKYKDKVADKNQSGVDGLNNDAFRKQMELMEVSAAQIKVYELAMRGATGAQLANAQAAATQIEALEAEKRAREGALKAAEELPKLEASLANERAALDALKGQNNLGALEGDARIEAERAIAQASEDAKYKILFEALNTEIEQKVQHGTLTEQIAVTQMQRMETLTEMHHARKLDISKRYMTEEEKFAAMTLSKQVAYTSDKLTQMTHVSATKHRALFEVNKIASKSRALVSGKEAVMDGYKFGSSWGGPVAGAFFAGVAAIETAAILSDINNANFGGGGTISSPGGGGGGSPSLPAAPSAAPSFGSADALQQAAPMSLTIKFDIQALDPNAITDETRQRIANSLAPAIQQAFNRNGQVQASMI